MRDFRYNNENMTFVENCCKTFKQSKKKVIEKFIKTAKLTVNYYKI